MALEATIKYGLQRIADAFREYATAHGWGADDYQVFVRLNLDWGRIHVILLAKTFPESDWHEATLAVRKFLQKKLKDEPALISSINLVLQTFDELREGGLYAIGSDYVEINELIRSGPVVGYEGPSPFAARSRE